jgi:hypothetical protein
VIVVRAKGVVVAARSSSLPVAAVMFALKVFVPVAALSYQPAWLPRAQAGPYGGCPDSIGAAMHDAQWAADRYAEIKDEHDTTGLFFDRTACGTRSAVVTRRARRPSWLGRCSARPESSPTVLAGFRPPVTLR